MGPKHAVLGAQVLDRFALPATDPACDQQDEELKGSGGRHGRRTIAHPDRAGSTAEIARERILGHYGLALLGEQPSLGIGEAKPLLPEPGPQHAVLGAQVLDRFALTATDPACDQQNDELERSGGCHGRRTIPRPGRGETHGKKSRDLILGHYAGYRLATPEKAPPVCPHNQPTARRDDSVWRYVASCGPRWLEPRRLRGEHLTKSSPGAPRKKNFSRAP